MRLLPAVLHQRGGSAAGPGFSEALVPIALADINLDAGLATIGGLDGYLSLRGLVRLHGIPVGVVTVPVINGNCSATAQSAAIVEQLSGAITDHHLLDLVVQPYDAQRWTAEALWTTEPRSQRYEQTSVTVAVCTRDRASDLERCLGALVALDYANLELLVIDNAPSDAATERLVTERFPHVRYVREDRPGLDWARNRAIQETSTEIVAFTDDDVVVDPSWVQAIAAAFAEDQDVMAVTGLVWPLELETEAQVLFERYGGFGRGFRRRWYWTDPARPFPTAWLGAGQFGTGANMAFRRSVFVEIGRFDPALDVGTVTNGGGDLEMFYRILKEGFALVYEPAALVRHRHRRDYSSLRTQLANNGVGMYSYLMRTANMYPSRRMAIRRFGIWWFWWWSVRRWLISWVLPTRFPRDLIVAEMAGVWRGLSRYPRARRIATALGATDLARSARRSGRESGPVTHNRLSPPPEAVAVREIHLDTALPALTDVTDYRSTTVSVMIEHRPIGSVMIDNSYRPISASRLRAAIVDGLGADLLECHRDESPATRWARHRSLLAEHLALLTDGSPSAPVTLPGSVPVSIVIATYDRPDHLRRCLASLRQLETARKIEIIIVDNHPASRLTPPIVGEFPGVILVEEPRSGLAYARNRGISRSSGAIIVATDDDVVVPSTWLEQLVAPFSRADVMAVTGNTLPLELSTRSQVLFERYGGLGRGFKRRTYDRAWFERFHRRAVPTWDIGATANAAFRAEIFADPTIGMLDEALGAGTPTGCSEDTYLFYKILRAGYTILYEPAAFVWHAHRHEEIALRRQIASYSTGHVAYHLTTLLRDHDPRAVPYLVFQLPRWRLRQYLGAAKTFVRRRSSSAQLPASLILQETTGNLRGPWALWRSRARVRGLGPSDPYILPSQRFASGQTEASPAALRTAGGAIPPAATMRLYGDD